MALSRGGVVPQRTRVWVRGLAQSDARSGARGCSIPSAAPQSLSLAKGTRPLRLDIRWKGSTLHPWPTGGSSGGRSVSGSSAPLWVKQACGERSSYSSRAFPRKTKSFSVMEGLLSEVKGELGMSKVSSRRIGSSSEGSVHSVCMNEPS